MSLKDDIIDILNSNSRENESNTPDFILAKYLISCLVAFEEATRQRQEWHGKPFVPGDIPWSKP